jgi:hypothetical protein
VIIAEVAAEADPGVVRDPIDRAAAHAFDSGSIVIAAAGNDNGPVTGPAREATVIGVGGRYPQNWLADTPTKPFQRFGSVDGRFKPEILGPTRTETAATCGDHAFTPFSRTSGATPYVGGAAAMINDWLAQTFKISDAGQTCAYLILSGSLQGPFANPEWGGAGLLGLPPLSSLNWVGKSEQMGVPREYELIPDAGVATDVTSIDAALWWPESMRDDGTRPHRRVKLELLDADGNVCGTSDDASNVFQRLSVPASSLGPVSVRRLVWHWVDIDFLWFRIRLRIPAALTSYRRIRITGPTATELAGETQTVYWAVAGRK